jgi:hypothetical protein
MQIHFEELSEAMRAAVEAFNRRLADGGSTARIAPAIDPAAASPILHQGVPQCRFLAVDETGAVRGAYTLKRQTFWIAGEVVSVCDLQYPVSEAVVNRRYSQIAARLMLDALKRHPMMYGLGMGGANEPVARLFKAVGYTLTFVPFYFYIVRPFAFLRNIAHLRRTAAKRLLLDALAWTGLGSLAVHAHHLLHGPKDLLKDTKSEVMDDFGSWTDVVWRDACDCYKVCSMRDAGTMQSMYPPGVPGLFRLKISLGARPVGWALLMNSALSNHRHFGNMRLGTIVDGFARPEHISLVIDTSRRWLEREGADLVVTNQMHKVWKACLRLSGFMSGPSNFLFASSPALTKKFAEEKIDVSEIHINRSDGDGPINL